MRLRTFLLIPVMLLVLAGTSVAQKVSVGEINRYLVDGARSFNAGDYEAAKTAYRKAWFVAAENSGYRKIILLNLGAVYMKTGSYDEAKDVLKEILTIDPGYKPAQLNLGLILEREKSQPEMRGYWLQVFDIDPDRIIEQNKPKEAVLIKSVNDAVNYEFKICP